MTHQITVAGLTVDVLRKKIRNLHLSVHPPDGRVRIATPQAISDESIRLYIIEKMSWIKRHQARFRAQPRQTLRQYQTRESHYFRGTRYLLYTVEQDRAPAGEKEKHPRVEIRQRNRMYLYVPKNATPQRREQILAGWYRAQLQDRVGPLMEKWQVILGVQAGGWHIRRMKTRWGSCHPDNGHIVFNLELIKKPESCLEYIVVHELVHLIERRHNENFTRLLDTYLPEWRLYRDQLNGFIL
jgi:predicted metal-dependent hydrolase